MVDLTHEVLKFVSAIGEAKSGNSNRVVGLPDTEVLKVDGGGASI